MKLLLPITLLLFSGWLSAGLAATEYSFRRGINISHWLSQNDESRPYGADWFSEEDVAWIAAQGFDHLRIPIDFVHVATPEGQLKTEALAPFDRACAWAQKNGLGVILDMHSLPGANFSTGDTALFESPVVFIKAEMLWSGLAAHYAEAGPWLRFELLNEPVAKENAQLNPVQAWLLQAIRRTNPTRVVYLTTNRSGGFAEVSDLSVPDDPNIALTLHFYEPFLFSHQGAEWLHLGGLPPIEFPGPVPSFQGFLAADSYWHQFSGQEMSVARSIEPPFDMLTTLLKQKGFSMEIHIGEFGALRKAPAESRARYYEAIVKAAERRGFSWAAWDYRGGFAIRESSGAPTAAMEGIARAMAPGTATPAASPAQKR